MAFVWTGTELIAEFRALTGISTTGELADATVLNWINDYYTNHFPEDIQVSEFHTDYTQDTSATDNGEYDLAQTVVTIDNPVYINDVEVEIYHDKARFYREFRVYEDYVSAPTLSIGVSSTSAITNAAFTYRLGNNTYAKATAETELSGDTVPQSTYGAWMLSIDSDGDITVTEAADNDTGYDTAALAIAGIPGVASTQGVMGFVTAINTGATFVPGTTSLSTGGTVTATYTDGNPGLRGTPTAVLLYGGKLTVRPKAQEVYRIDAKMVLRRPTALGTSDAVTDIKWGPAVATKAAVMYLNSRNDIESALQLSPLMDERLNSIRRKKIIKWKTRRQEPVL